MNSSQQSNDVFDIENDQYIETPFDIIESYFKGHHLERLVRHQIESYNNFVGYQIIKTIEMFNPVHIASEQDLDPVSKKYSLAMNDSLLIELEKDNWPAMKDFHKTMAQTFHPSEKGDLIPLRNRSGELLAKAILLKESIPPKSFDANLIQKGLQNLEEKCNEVNVLVEKNAKDAVLIKKIREAHDLFHVVQGLCHD
jgi:hypothetical protein